MMMMKMMMAMTTATTRNLEKRDEKIEAETLTEYSRNQESFACRRLHEHQHDYAASLPKGAMMMMMMLMFAKMLMFATMMLMMPISQSTEDYVLNVAEEGEAGDDDF